MKDSNKVLVVVDMQNDFCTEGGSLANKEEISVVGGLANYIREHGSEYRMIICTLDTHSDNYLETNEGKYLPVKHCIKGTWGHMINKEINDSIRDVAYGVTEERTNSDKRKVMVVYTEKPTFCSPELCPLIYSYLSETVDSLEIDICGVCTDICVVSNALSLKSTFYGPNQKISVLKDYCAGVTVENHDAALKVMNSCQIEIK